MSWKRWYRRPIVKLFLKLLPDPDYGLTEKEKEKMGEFLARSNSLIGFKAYFKLRDYALMKSFGSGVTRDEYLILYGRRLELLQLIGEAKLEADMREKKKKKD